MTGRPICERCYRWLNDTAERLCIDCAEEAWKSGELCVGCSGEIATLGVGSKDEEGFVLCPGCNATRAPDAGLDMEMEDRLMGDPGDAGWAG